MEGYIIAALFIGAVLVLTVRAYSPDPDDPDPPSDVPWWDDDDLI